jgi:dipeptidase E
MKYILTSNANSVTSSWSEELGMNQKKLTAAFIDTAADVYDKANADWLKADRASLTDLGLTVTDYSLVDKTKEQVMNELEKFDILFVSGGNTFYLLEHSNKSGFTQLIKEDYFKDKLYIGSSAGSVLLSNSIEPIKFLDDPSVTSLTSYEAIGLLDFTIYPHWGSPHFKKKYQQATQYAYDHAFAGFLLADHQYLVIDEQGMRLVSVEM